MESLITKKTRREKILLYALPFTLPVVFLGAAFALCGVYPFGDKMILTYDFAHQIYPFISDFSHKLKEGHSLLWSWTAGAGHDYISHIAYFLSSPFTLLAALFPHAILREVLTAFLLLKIGLMGLFMSIYLQYISERRDIMLPAFAVMYALCGFTLGYYWTTIWFDALAIFPLVMLGVHKLVTEGKFQLYVLTLAAAMILNFYIGMFVCVFTAILFLIVCAAQKLKPREFFIKLSAIAAFSAIALGMAAFIILPALTGLRRAFRSVDPTQNMFPDAVRLLNSFPDVLGGFTAFTPPTNLKGPPNLYSGMISVMLLPVFFRSGKVPRREKVAYGIVTVFLLLSTNVNVLEFIWHGFSYPTDIPARFSFLISFLLIFMAYRAYLLLEDFKKKDIVVMGVATAVLHIMAAFARQKILYILLSAILCGIFLWLFAAISIKGKVFRRYRGNRADRANKLKNVIFALILAELFFSACIGVRTAGTATVNRDHFPPQYDSYQHLLDLSKPAENDFYRTELSKPWSHIDNSFYGYNGISTFSSLINANTLYYMESLAMPVDGKNNLYGYSETTPLNNAFLNMRYLINYDASPADDGVYWDRVAEFDDLILLENNHYLPLGFMVNEETLGYQGIGADNPFRAQNDLFSRATGLNGDLFTIVDTEGLEFENCEVSCLEPGKYSFSAFTGASYDSLFLFNYKMPSDGCLYVFAAIEGGDTAMIFDAGETFLRDMAIGRPYIFCAGSFKRGDSVSVLLSSNIDNGSITIYAGFPDNALFDQGFSLLADEALELTYFSDTKITGRITVLEDGLLYTSIPYAGLWKAFVDGSEVEITPVYGAMTAIMLSSGDHIVEFQYHNSSLATGVVISIIAAVVFIVMKLLSRLRLTARKSLWERLIFQVIKLTIRKL